MQNQKIRIRLKAFDYKLMDNGIEDSLLYVETLGAYAADKKYFPKLRSIIKKLRTEYDIPQIN